MGFPAAAGNQSGLRRNSSRASAGARTIKIPADRRPSAVSVCTSPVTRTRSRIVSAIASSTSARLPPSGSWIKIAVTTRSKSGDCVRASTRPSAVSSGTPSCDFPGRPGKLRRQAAAAALQPQSASPWENEYPARSAEVSSISASGSCVSNRRRRVCRRASGTTAAQRSRQLRQAQTPAEAHACQQAQQKTCQRHADAKRDPFGGPQTQVGLQHRAGAGAARNSC